jgi:hypothetical protein
MKLSSDLLHGSLLDFQLGREEFSLMNLIFHFNLIQIFFLSLSVVPDIDAQQRQTLQKMY